MDEQDREPASEEAREQLALRWAVLSCWHADLKRQGQTFQPPLQPKLEEARIKIVTGAYSACTASYTLAEIEAALTTKGASVDEEDAAIWQDRLAQTAEDPGAAQDLLCIPALKSHYLDCGSGPCDAGDVTVD